MNWSDLFLELHYASIVSALAPIVFYFFCRNRSELIKTVFVLLLISFAFDLGNKVSVALGYQGYLISNIYTAIEITLLCVVYLLLLAARRRVYICFMVFWIVFVISSFFEPVSSYQSIPLLYESLVMIFFSLSFYLDLYQRLPVENVLRYPPTWINSAVFFYFSFDLLLFISFGHILKNEDALAAMAFWSFHNLNNIIKNMFFAVGIYCEGRK